MLSDDTRSVATLTLGTVVAQGLTVAVTPILSRLFTPADFGIMAVFLSVATVVATFITLRYEILILIPKEDRDARQLVFLCFVTIVLLGIILILTSYLLRNYTTNLFNISPVSWWVTWACCVGMIIALNTTVIGWLNRIKLYKEIAFLRIMQSIIFSGIAIMLGVNDFDYDLLLAHTITALILLLFGIRYIPGFAKINIKSIALIAKNYSRAPKYMLPTALLDVITMQAPIILIGFWYGTSESGQFTLAWRVLILPSLLIGAAVGQVFYQKFASTWPDSKAALSLLVNTWLVLALFGILPMLTIIFAGEEIFSFVFGPDWTDSGKMAAILAPMLFISLLHSPTSMTSVVLGMQKRVLLISLLALIYRPLSLYIGWKIGNIYIGLTIYCVSEIALILLFQYFVYKKIKAELPT